MSCPGCHATGRALILFSRKHRLGQKRRYECRSCGHRWTLVNGETVANLGPTGTGRLTLEQVERILCSDISSTALAREMQVSRTLICKIRHGCCYRTFLPELRRNG